MDEHAGKSDLMAALMRRRREIVEFTRRLVEIPTENPPGTNYGAAAQFLAKTLEKLRLRPDMVGTSSRGGECAPVIQAHLGTGRRTLIFHGHYDVVPANDANQFRAVVRKDAIFGRGAGDMKGGLAAMIYAAVALRDCGTRLAGSVRLTFVPDEETGGRRGSVVLSKRKGFVRGAVGMLTPEPTGGVVWNANRGALTLRIGVRGKTAHVGQHYRGVNAFEEMVGVVRALGHLRTAVSRRKTREAIRPARARSSILLIGGTSGGGTNFNAVPDTAWFTVDRRLNPEERLDRERKRLLKVLERERARGVNVQVEVLQEGVSARSPVDHPVARALARSVAEITGKPPRFEMCPGLLETRFYARRGVPAYAFGPGLFSVAHGPHEYVSVRKILECAAAYALTAARVLA